jgi:hypothetical protein
LSATRINDFTFLNKLLSNNLIVNNKNKITSTNFLLKDQSYNINISSSKFGSYSNKPNYSYRIIGNLNTPNYILNNTNNNFYIIQNYTSFLSTNKGINAGIGNNFTSSKLKTRFENDFSISSRKSVSSQNNTEIYSIANNYQLENKIMSKFKGMFNFQLNNTFSFSTNKRNESNILYKAVTDIIGVDVNINYLKKSHIDIEARNFYFNTFNGNIQNIFLVNLSYKQLLHNNKIRLNLELRNLTDNKAFISQNISTTQFYENKVALLPFFALLKLEFLL